MAKVLTYVIMLTFICAGFGVLGLADTNTSKLIASIGGGDELGGFKASNMWELVFGTASGIIATLGLSGVLIAGLYRQIPVTQIVLAGFSAVLLGWITGDLISIWTAVGGATQGDFLAIGLGIKVLITALIGGAVISGIQWWAGQDF